MRTLFLRIALVLFVTVDVGLALIAYVAISSYLERLVERHIEDTERVHAILTTELRGAGTAEGRSAIERVEALLGYRIDVVDSSDARPPGAAPLVEHTMSSLFEDVIAVTRPIAGGDGAAIRYERTYVAEWAREDTLLLALLFLALPVALYLTLRPVARKITDLGEVAREYAAGRLDARSTVPAPRPLEHLTDDIHDMASALALKLREQSVMTYAISHELKTPLTRLRMANDLAIRETDPQAWRQHLLELDDDLTALEKIIAETLTLSRLTSRSGPLEMGEVALRELVLESVRECAPNGPAVELDIPSDVSVIADRDAIKRALVNVLGNASRFARQRVRVAVEARGERWVIAIEDDGPGIAASEREKVLMPFGRVENSRCRASGSTGMGLAIATLLTGKCDGSIRVDDSPLGGARFRIALMAARPSDEAMTNRDKGRR